MISETAFPRNKGFPTERLKYPTPTLPLQHISQVRYPQQQHERLALRERAKTEAFAETSGPLIERPGDEGARADEVRRREARISAQVRVPERCTILLLDALSSLLQPRLAAGRSARSMTLLSRYQTMRERESSGRGRGGEVEANHP